MNFPPSWYIKDLERFGLEWTIKPPEDRPLCVQWKDSHRREGWHSFGDSPESHLVVTTIGFLIDESTETITVSSSVTFHRECLSPITIPKCTIIDLFPINYEPSQPDNDPIKSRN